MSNDTREEPLSQLRRDLEYVGSLTPKAALDLATKCESPLGALIAFKKAVGAFREALGDVKPQGRKASEIAEELLGRDIHELRHIRDALNKKFETKRAFHL